jgi:hypothetical protein
MSSIAPVEVRVSERFDFPQLSGRFYALLSFIH